MKRCVTAAWLAGLLVCSGCGSKASTPGTPSNEQGNKAGATAGQAVAAEGSITRDVRVSAFTVKVPAEWASFSPGEASSLREQFEAQSKQIYRQYSGGDIPVKSLDLAAFHLAGNDGGFILVSFAIPPQSDLVNVLKSQAKDKADWGIQNGYIRKFLGIVPIDDDQFSGFYLKMIGKNGDFEVSAGLEPKKLKSTLVQLTLLCPQTWDQDKGEKTLASLLKTLTLAK